MWRCPHCGTPQAETARCWVCRRSSTACGTCRNFRRAVAGSLGYCGLDRRRQPLAGDEIRECWEASPGGIDLTMAPASAASAASAVSAATTAAAAASGTERATPLEFVEVRGRLASEPVAPVGEPAAPAVEPAAEPSVQPRLPSPGLPAFGPPPPPASEPGWSLWGDLDR